MLDRFLLIIISTPAFSRFKHNRCMMVIKSSLPEVFIPEEPLASLLFAKILEYGDKVAMIDTTAQKTITFREIYDRARKCASSLHKQGLKCGDIVGLCAPSCTEFPVITLAVLACGATVTTINPAYKEGEVIQQFAISEPRMVFVAENSIELIKNVSTKIRSIEKIFVIGKSDEFTTVTSLTNAGVEKDFPQNVPIDVHNDAAFLLYSSGTTGMPKSVMLHHHCLASTMAICKIHFSIPDVCLYTDRPMFHYGGMFTMLVGLHFGVKLVQEQVFDVVTMLKAIEQHKVTLAISVPPMMISLLQAPDVDKYDTSSLKRITCSGAAVAPALMTKLKNQFHVEVVQVYGLTETGGVTYQSATAPQNSVGEVISNTSIKILDLQTGRELGPSRHGEILVKGPQNMKGYLKNPEATSETIDKDGWLHTGDIGYYDENEFLYVIDRLKEVIKYKTFQVPPAEIESVLLKHPKIADVGVIGIPDEYAGEIPMAFVVKSEQSLTGNDVTKFVEGELADYKHLRGGVRFTDVIPKSLQGKIQRKELKKMAEALLL